MSATSTNTDPIPGPSASGADSIVKPGIGATLWEYFQRLFVVALGIFLGTILAFIIALFAKWAELKC